MTIPAIAHDLALRLGASPARIGGPVTLAQTGRMKLKLEADLWLPFTARQTIEVTTCAFAWRARFWPLGFLTVLDALVAGQGRLDVTALGVFPLVRAKASAALTKGELQRYLAELPYVPDAMLHNPDLEWREAGQNQLAVAAGTGDARAEVMFTLDPDGRIGSLRAEDRPRSAVPPTQPTPWEGEFADYRLHQGRWVPFSGQVAWVIGGQRRLYWRGVLTRWALGPPVPVTQALRPVVPPYPNRSPALPLPQGHQT